MTYEYALTSLGTTLKFKSWQRWERSILDHLAAGRPVRPAFRGEPLEELQPAVIAEIDALNARCPIAEVAGLYPRRLKPQCAAILEAELRNAVTEREQQPLVKRLEQERRPPGRARGDGPRMRQARERLELGFVSNENLDTLLFDIAQILRLGR